VYSFFGIVLVIIVFSPLGKDYVPLSYLCTVLIFLRTYFIPSRSSCIFPLWCLVSSKYFVAQSCTFYAMRSVSSFVIMYLGGSLCTFSFLCDPPVYEIGRLGGPSFYGVYVEGVRFVFVAPAPCSFCCGAVSFFPACAYLFGTPPFFCCVGFCIGFGLLGTILSPVGVLFFPTSTSVPLGTS
jgi:hypothetical protein